jgi:predicted Ser/Thr protein kinase
MGCCSSLCAGDGKAVRLVEDPASCPVDQDVDLAELSDVQFVANGGMCSIFSASFRGGRVALKLPREDCAQPDIARHDLESEISVLSKLRCNNN